LIGPDPVASALAIQIDVPWDQSNRRHQITLTLLTEDGRPVTAATSEGDQPVKIDGEFEVGRPAGHRPGTPLSVALAMNVGPLPLTPDSRFEWRCEIDGETNDDWVAGFLTRPAKP